MTIFIQPEINRFWIFLEAATLVGVWLYCVVFVEWNKWINTSTIFVQIYSWITNLNNFVQIGQSLMLVHLCHAKLLDEQFFNIFELVNLKKIKRKKWENWKFVILTNLFMNVIDFHVSFFMEKLVVLPLLLFYYLLTFHFHMNKLSFTLVNIVSLFPFSPVIEFLISDTSFEKLLFLINHYTFHSHSSLLDLKFILLNSLLMCLLLHAILHLDSFDIF